MAKIPISEELMSECSKPPLHVPVYTSNTSFSVAAFTPHALEYLIDMRLEIIRWHPARVGGVEIFWSEQNRQGRESDVACSDHLC